MMNMPSLTSLPVSFDAYIRKGWSLVAIPPMTKGPKTKDWNKKENVITNSSLIPQGFGVGLAHAYSGTMALDIDNLDDSIAYLAGHGIDLMALLNAPDAVTIDSGNGGHAKLLYAMPEGLVLNSKKLINTRVDGSRYDFMDFRCANSNGTTQQCVLPPSIHPTTLRPYQWGGRGTWESVPQIPFGLLLLWQSLLADDAERTIKVSGSVDASWDEIRGALDHISPDVSRDEWLKVGMALHHAGTVTGQLDAAYSLFNEWSAQGEKYQGERDINGRWRSFKADDGITLGTLFHIAKEHGWSRLIPDASPLFGSIPAGDGQSANRYKLKSVLDVKAVPKQDWVIKGVLPENGLAAIYGPSGSGKTFLAMNMVLAIAKGEPWFGIKTKKRPIVYLALEGEGGLGNRIQAYEREASIEGHVFFVTQLFSFLKKSDVPQLAEAIREHDACGGIVLVDTLNRASPGMDENSSADMGDVISAAKQLQIELGGLVLLVHHTGKVADRGMRGHSSLHAALDTAIEVTRNGEYREWKVAKSKDGQEGEGHSFRLNVVDLGMDEDGDPITSCAVTPEAAVIKRTDAKTPKGGNQKIILDALRRLLSDSLDFGMAGAPRTSQCVNAEEAISKTKGCLTVPADRCAERARSAVTGLIAKGVIRSNEGWLWLA